MREFQEEELQRLYKPHDLASDESNGRVTIIGGSRLFHGAPILALKTASRIVDMVFFASPEPSVGKVAEKLKSKLGSFIWVPWPANARMGSRPTPRSRKFRLRRKRDFAGWEEVGDYIKKSDAVLIGPGLMRYHKKIKNEKLKMKNLDRTGLKTKKITEGLLQEFPNKQWVIDAGSLQVMEPKSIPKMAILTPNKKEYQLLFGETKPEEAAKEYHCIIVAKNVKTIVCSPKKCRVIKGGNAGLTKGGTGDVLAGLTVALAAKNPPFLAACAASYIAKKAADELYKEVGFAYNADDLAEKIPEVLGKYFR